MVKITSFIRRSLTLWFALIAWIGGLLSGDPYIRSGNMEIANTLEYTYADGVSFCQGLATDGKIFYGIGCYKFLDYNAITKIDIETGVIIAYGKNLTDITASTSIENSYTRLFPYALSC